MEKNDPHERQETVKAKSLFISPGVSSISAMYTMHTWAGKEF